VPESQAKEGTSEDVGEDEHSLSVDCYGL